MPENDTRSAPSGATLLDPDTRENLAIAAEDVVMASETLHGAEEHPLTWAEASSLIDIIERSLTELKFQLATADHEEPRS